MALQGLDVDDDIGELRQDGAASDGSVHEPGLEAIS
jgi:hypothetical protein